VKFLVSIILLFLYCTSNIEAKSNDHLLSVSTLHLKHYTTFNPDDLTHEDTSKYTFDKRYEKIIKELAYMQVFALATIGTIGILPEGISHWSQEDKAYANSKDLIKKHSDHIKRGPVWDNDAWAVNYIGHPVAGSYFYVWGRQSGLSWQESAVLSTLMSTVFWEYGWEAFAETPSIQDLIVTPLLGSILGEGSNHLYNKILQNKGMIYNSILLGDIGRLILNPIGEMNSYFDTLFQKANIEISVDYAYNDYVDTYRLRHSIENDTPKQSYFKLNFKLKY
jgi:hypothetical protein